MVEIAAWSFILVKLQDKESFAFCSVIPRA
jgi:hypothetical protein